MNSWSWNQHQGQQNLWMGTNPNQQSVNNVHMGAVRGFHPYSQVLPAQRLRVPSVPQRFMNRPLLTLPQQQHFPHLLQQNGLLPTPSHPQQQNFSQGAVPSPIQKSSYQVEEIRQARKSLSIYFDQIPPRLRSWQPLAQDNQVNIWEGEAGMMEHCKRPFPMPVQGEVKSGAAVWSPEQGTSGIGSRSVPPSQTISVVDKEDLPQEVVSVSDEEDSDVQVMPSSPASVIFLEDSPLVPTRQKKKRKRKVQVVEDVEVSLNV